MEQFGKHFRATGSELGFRLDKPFYWRVASGVLYAEMPFTANIRPPLLSEWESTRVQAFKSKERRDRWLAGRALAKALVRERLGLTGIIEIRDGSDGQPLVYSDGMPLPDVWLGIASRSGRVASVVADRPVSLEIRPVDGSDVDIARNVLRRGELRVMRRAISDVDAAVATLRAAKEAAIRAIRASNSTTALVDVEVRPDFAIEIGDVTLSLMAVRVLEDAVVAVVARPLLNEPNITRFVLDGEDPVEPSTRLQGAIERSMLRARRIAEARQRWQRPRWA